MIEPSDDDIISIIDGLASLTEIADSSRKIATALDHILKRLKEIDLIEIREEHE